MKLPRHSIRWVMVVVAVVAFNIAVARVAVASNPEILIGGALPCIALQWAAISLLRRRGRARAFWVGFTILGSLITASFVWAMLFPEVLGITRDGALVKTPGSPLHPIWMRYGQLVGERIGPMLFDFGAKPEPYGMAMLAFRGLLWSLPQFLLASVGGLIAWGAAGAVGSRPRPGGLGGPPPRGKRGRKELRACRVAEDRLTSRCSGPRPRAALTHLS